jgi:hypothetical protein
MTSLLFDFSDPRSMTLWNPINDSVMGGVSQSQLRIAPAGHAVFVGQISFENNGGFASVRSLPCDLGRKNVSAYILEVCGDGKRYKLNLRTDSSFDGVNYQAQFDPPAGIWTTCRLASADFLPSWRGRSVPDAPPLDTTRVRQIGLMIADRQEGSFVLAIRSIAVEIT